MCPTGVLCTLPTYPPTYYTTSLVLSGGTFFCGVQSKSSSPCTKPRKFLLLLPEHPLLTCLFLCPSVFFCRTRTLSSRIQPHHTFGTPINSTRGGIGKRSERTEVCLNHERTKVCPEVVRPVQAQGPRCAPLTTVRN